MWFRVYVFGNRKSYHGISRLPSFYLNSNHVDDIIGGYSSRRPRGNLNWKENLMIKTSALSTVWKKKKIGVTKADKCTKTTSFRDLFKKQLRIQGSKGGNYYFLFEFRTRSKYSSMYSSSTSTDFTKLKSSTTSSKSFSSIYVVWTVFWQSWWIRK